MYGEIAYHVITKLYHGEVAEIIDNRRSAAPYFPKRFLRSTELANFIGIDVLICAGRAFDEIYESVLKYESQDICIYDIKDILIDAKELNRMDLEFSFVYGNIDVEELCRRYHYGEECKGDSRFVMPNMGICLTTRCSLKCKNCVAFMPDYTNPKDYNMDSIIENFSKILAAVDAIQEVDLIGGEPFLYRDIEGILRWCIEKDKIQAVKIITNGTIMPEENIWRILANPKCYLEVDRYGMLSKKYDDIMEMAKKHRVRCNEFQLQTWYQSKPIIPQALSKEEITDKFRKCIFKTCWQLNDGKVFTCNVLGHMTLTKLIPDDRNNYIVLEGVEWDAQALRKRLQMPDYLPGCAYCRAGEQIEVPIAEQL